MNKKWFHQKPIQIMLAMVLAAYMNLVKNTTKWRVEGTEKIEPIWHEGHGVIAALWHGRILMSMRAWSMQHPPNKQTPCFVISRSNDGNFIARIIETFGAQTIQGSARDPNKPGKNKGGLSAFRKMIAHIKANGCLAITPDGPRGPRHTANLGAVQLAAKTGAPIMCMGWSTTRGIFISSWDKLYIPLPFARGVIVWGGPIFVPKNADKAILEAKRAELQHMLQAITLRADRACGRHAKEHE